MKNTILKIVALSMFVALLAMAAIFPPEMTAQSDSYNFYTVSSVPAQGNATWYNSTFAILEDPYEPTSSGPFICGWPSYSSGTQPDMTVVVTFDPSAAGTYSGSCSVMYYDESEGGEYLKATLTLSGTYTPPAVGILYPKFKIASIIYDTPGNHSNNGFTNTLTDGTTTSTGSNFGVGVTDTFSLTGGFLGTGSTLSWSYGNAATSGNTTAVTDTIADATGVLNATNTSAPNAVNHQQDLFIIWLNPAITFTQTGTTSATYSMGTQLQTTGDPSPGKPEIQDQVEVFAQAMMANSSGVTTVPLQTLKPQVVDSQTLPGLANICAKLIAGYPTSCTLANQCGCVPSDFTAVLNQDPLLNFTSTESPLNANTSSAALCTNPKSSASCRYVPIMVANGSSTQEVELLQGPDDVGGNNPINTFTQTDSTQTTQTYTQTYAYSVGYSWDVSWKILGTGLDFKSATLFTWTNSESTGEINGSAHQMSVSLSSSTVGCSEYIPIFEDTTYHTFVFQGQVGDSSCP